MFLSLSSAGVLSLLISITIARSLGVADFGAYSILISVQGVVSLVAGFGLGTGIAKFVAEYMVKDRQQALKFAKSGLVLVLILSIITGAVYTVLSGIIGNGLYEERMIVSLIPLSALVVFSSAILSIATGMSQGCQRIKLLASIQISVPLLSLLLILLFLALIGIKGVFVGYFVSQLTVSFMAFLKLNGDLHFSTAPLELSPKSVTMSRLLAFALPTFLGGIMVTPVYWLGNTELTLQSGFQAMGYFAIALVFYQSLTVIPNAIALPMMPRVSELSSGTREHIEKLVARVMKILSVILFPFLFAIALLSRSIVELLYGSSYSSASEAVYLMVTASYFYALGIVIGSMIVGIGRMWLGLGLNVLWAAMFLLLSFLTIPQLGTTGLGLAYAISYGVFLVILLLVSKEILRVEIKGVYVMVASSSVLFLLGFLVANEGSSCGLLGNVALYVAALVLFLIVGREAFATLFKMVRGFWAGAGF